MRRIDPRQQAGAVTAAPDRMNPSQPPPLDLPAMLGGGDLRSIGRADEVARRVLTRPDLFAPLLHGMLSSDPVLRARCADVAEKVSAVHPDWLVAHKDLLITRLACNPQPAMRWHVAPMLARLPLDDRERARVVALLTGWLRGSGSLVATMAMQALADLAERHEALRPEVVRHLRELSLAGTPAMRARGRKLLKRLDR